MRYNQRDLWNNTLTKVASSLRNTLIPIPPRDCHRTNPIVLLLGLQLLLLQPRRWRQCKR